MNITIENDTTEGKRIAYNCWGGFPLMTMLKIRVLALTNDNLFEQIFATKLLLTTYIFEKNETREGMRDPNNLYLKFDYDYYDYFEGDRKNFYKCEEFENNLQKIKNLEPFDFFNIQYEIKKNGEKSLRIGTAKMVVKNVVLSKFLGKLYTNLYEFLENSKRILSRKDERFDYLEIKK